VRSEVRTRNIVGENSIGRETRSFRGGNRPARLSQSIAQSCAARAAPGLPATGFVIKSAYSAKLELSRERSNEYWDLAHTERDGHG
jgi:hypothetical protein